MAHHRGLGAVGIVRLDPVDDLAMLGQRTLALALPDQHVRVLFLEPAQPAFAHRTVARVAGDLAHPRVAAQVRDYARRCVPGAVTLLPADPTPTTHLLGACASCTPPTQPP